MSTTPGAWRGWIVLWSPYQAGISFVFVSEKPYGNRSSEHSVPPIRVPVFTQPLLNVNVSSSDCLRAPELNWRWSSRLSHAATPQWTPWLHAQSPGLKPSRLSGAGFSKPVLNVIVGHREPPASTQVSGVPEWRPGVTPGISPVEAESSGGESTPFSSGQF